MRRLPSVPSIRITATLMATTTVVVAVVVMPVVMVGVVMIQVVPLLAAATVSEQRRPRLATMVACPVAG